jgi:hypothetical protein
LLVIQDIKGNTKKRTKINAISKYAYRRFLYHYF